MTASCNQFPIITRPDYQSFTLWKYELLHSDKSAKARKNTLMLIYVKIQCSSQIHREITTDILPVDNIIQIC